MSININNDQGLPVKDVKDVKEKEEKKSKEQSSKHKIQIIFKNGDDIRQDMLTL